MKDFRKKPLYRKVNTTAHNVGHDKSDEPKYVRNTKKGISRKMKKGVKRGLDYTPLYKFLLSKVGSDWDAIYYEAQHRLDKEEPIFWMVSLTGEFERGGNDICRVGESTYFSRLYVDENNILQKVNPDLSIENLYPSCKCCTHSFNGEVFRNKWDYDKPFIISQ